MSTDSENIDTRNIKETDCKPGYFPLEQLGMSERPDGFQIVVRRSTLNAMKIHGQSSKHAEVSGMLVGNLYWDNGPFLMVEASIIGKHAVSNVASVTFTAEMWEHIWAEQEKNYSDTRIIGWYHTHPGFGVFLSNMDVFICKHTFFAPHQVAYVYDSQSDAEGWFSWKNSVPERINSWIIEDVPVLSTDELLPQSELPDVSLTPQQSQRANSLYLSSLPNNENIKCYGQFIATLIILNLVLTLISSVGVAYLIFKLAPK